MCIRDRSGALDAFRVDVHDLYCLDIGCSSGGFTDCLLKRGARRVVSVDVGHAQFDWSLRNDERVDLHERTNIVDLPAQGFNSSFDLAVCDVSFTSIRTILQMGIRDRSGGLRCGDRGRVRAVHQVLARASGYRLLTSKQACNTSCFLAYFTVGNQETCILLNCLYGAVCRSVLELSLIHI